MDRPTADYIRRMQQLCAGIYAQGKLSDLRDLLYRACGAFGDRDCVAEKVRGSVVTYSFSRLFADVRALGTYLLRSGFSGKHIAILGENSYHWLVAFFAVTCSGNVAVPLDKELSSREIAMLLGKADCDTLFCSASYMDRALAYVQRRPDFHYILFPADGYCNTIRSCIREGERMLRHGSTDFDDCTVQRDDTAALLFTSGTTGSNKGVLLSHRNFVSNVDGVIETNDPVYSVLSVLPMNHAYELGSSILPHVYCGAVICFNDRLRNFFRNIREFQPEYIAIVPLFAENICRAIRQDAERAGRLEKLERSIKDSARLLSNGVDRRAELFEEERKAFGYMFPYLACGGAPLRPETASFLDALGFPLLLGYGLTETSPIVTLNQQAGKYPSSVGVPFPGVQVRLDDPDADGVGEIWVKGSNVSSGYYKDEDATRMSFEDGWFKTGDFGRFGSQGELYITGRKKNLILLSNGKNIYPEELEYFFSSNLPDVQDAVVFETTRRVGTEEMAVLALAVTLREDADAAPEPVRQAALRVNRQLPGFKRVQDVWVSPEPFVRTSTKKILRHAVKEQYEHAGTVTKDF